MLVYKKGSVRPKTIVPAPTRASQKNAWSVGNSDSHSKRVGETPKTGTL